MKDLVIDMSNPREKALLLDGIRNLQGMHRVTVVQHRARRSDRQNRYFHPCFVAPFADWLRGQGYAVSDEDAKTILKDRFLKRTIVSPKTGEEAEYTRHTSELDTSDMNNFLDQCRNFLWEFAGIHVPDPSIYRQPLVLEEVA